MPRNMIALAIAAALWIGGAALSPQAVAAEQLPFSTNMLTGNAELTPTDDACIMRNEETGSGKATHLGMFTWTDVELVDFCAIPDGVSVVGWFTMTAASGDLLHGELTTTGVFDQDGNLLIDGDYVFTGGTGRFADATGSGEIEVTAFLSPGLPFEGKLRGTIDY